MSSEPRDCDDLLDHRAKLTDIICSECTVSDGFMVEHVMGSSGMINKVRNRQISGKKDPVHKKTCVWCVENDLKACSLTEEPTHNRELWRSSAKNC